MEAVELTLQGIIYLALAFSGRAFLRELCLKRLTYFKSTNRLARNWVANSIIEFSRSGLLLKDRYLHLLVLSIYTTAITILLGAGAEPLREIKTEVVFTILLLAASIIRVFLAESKGAELRQALLVPLFAILILALFESILFVTGTGHFSSLAEMNFLFLASVSHFLGFLVCIFLTFLLFLAGQGPQKANSWNALVNGVGQIAWVTPILIIFLTPGGEWGWMRTLLVSIEVIFFLLFVDFVGTFFPIFQTIQTEKFTIRYAIPAVLSVFVLIWIMGAVQ